MIIVNILPGCSLYFRFKEFLTSFFINQSLISLFFSRLLIKPFLSLLYIDKSISDFLNSWVGSLFWYGCTIGLIFKILINFLLQLYILVYSLLVLIKQKRVYIFHTAATQLEMFWHSFLIKLGLELTLLLILHFFQIELEWFTLVIFFTPVQ